MMPKAGRFVPLLAAGRQPLTCMSFGMSTQVDNWLNQRPFDGPAEKAPQAQGPVIVIGAGPAGLAAAYHLKVSKQSLEFVLC